MVVAIVPVEQPVDPVHDCKYNYGPSECDRLIAGDELHKGVGEVQHVRQTEEPLQPGTRSSTTVMN